ncbi:BTB/POZ domain-containing protein 19-like [Elysia marginata]|uniref:BTB/POZ domain-containing protein 19-like n=1 Tax=Elysia marginata TaxID=1093978 RepID=A0AAV4HRL0_9GAST|nr:BTB/POZ domain-containing protein 19-like [Elysia marginata]
MNQADVTTLMQGKAHIYAAAMKKLINNREFSDVSFRVGASQEIIYGHQNILAAHCTVFKAMFLDPNRESQEMCFDLADMTPPIFLAMLEYIYTNCILLNSHIAVDVLATALEYGLDDLRDLCVEFLIQNLKVSNACDVMQSAVTYNQNDLKEMAMVYIEDNTQEVLSSESFKDISEDALVTIIRSSKLKIDEIDLIKAVKVWATVNSVADQKQICQMARDAIKHIRLPLLSPDELSKLEEESKVDLFIPTEMFSSAKELVKQGNKDHILCTVRRGTVSQQHHNSNGL